VDKQRRSPDMTASDGHYGMIHQTLSAISFIPQVNKRFAEHYSANMAANSHSHFHTLKGTTGKPKGVGIHHSKICNFVSIVTLLYGFMQGNCDYQGSQLFSVLLIEIFQLSKF
jgi:hypothetical protein